MQSSSKIVSFGNYDLTFKHLLIIGILILSFSVSVLMRSQSADFGVELNEFDPFFNYRATQYIVDNGVDAYYEWDDDFSWYPHGRDVSATSQVMLHMTAAYTYWIFGGNSDLYDFTIWFPVVFSSLTSIVIFALVRVIGGTTAGLFSALLYSISLPILIRSPIGWFKSEPLGLFFGLLMLYLLLSGLNSQNKKIAFSKLIGAGIISTFAISAWGGTQFFILPVGLFFITLPFLRNDHKFLLQAIPLYTITTLLASLAFERGISFSSLGGISLITSTVFVIVCIFIQQKSSKHKSRNGLLLLIALLIIAPSVLVINVDNQFLPLPSHRYLNAINPFLTTTDPLVDSISEHATTTLSQSFFFHSVLMIFSGIGIWLIIKKSQNENTKLIQNDMLSFSLILGLIGVYISSTFVRLEVFASIALILLTSLGLSALIKEFFNDTHKTKQPLSKIIKIPFVTGILILLVIPLVYPVDGNVISTSKIPMTILNGGTAYTVATNDWLDALDWIKNNSEKDAVIASWWDYGYWISTMGERASLADNSTLNTKLIQNIAKMFLSAPDDAWRMLQEMQADYVVVFVAAEKLDLGTPESYYRLGGGGDESKKQWFIRIAEDDMAKFVYVDGFSGTDYFWNETILGKMIPFSPLGYVNPQNILEQYPTYVPGTLGIYGKEIKLSSNDSPLKLVYASPSFTEEKLGPVIGVFIYEVNDNYQPTT